MPSSIGYALLHFSFLHFSHVIFHRKSGKEAGFFSFPYSAFDDDVVCLLVRRVFISSLVYSLRVKLINKENIK